MPAEDSNANNAAQVREVIESWAQAIGAKDVEGAMACFAPDVLTFDLRTASATRGTGGHQKGFGRLVFHLGGADRP